MKLDPRVLESDSIELSHNEIRNVQGGNQHLTASEYTKLRWLIEHKDDLRREVAKKTYGLYTFGSNAPKWTGVEDNNETRKVMRKLTLPQNVRPVKVVSANNTTLCVLGENDITYAYGTGVNYYVLNSKIKPTDLSVPYEVSLGAWVDIHMPGYWVVNVPTSDVVPITLTDTSVHNTLPRCTGGACRDIRYTDSDSVSINTSIACTPKSGATIKSMMYVIVKDRYSLVHTTAGLCEIVSSNVNAPRFFADVTFPYGMIKNVWITDSGRAYVLNTNNLLYQCTLNITTGSITWAALGEFDVKCIAINFNASIGFMLTNSGELYYQGLNTLGMPNSSNTFTRVHENYLFEDITGLPETFAGIGYKLD